MPEAACNAFVIWMKRSSMHTAADLSSIRLQSRCNVRMFAVRREMPYDIPTGLIHNTVRQRRKERIMPRTIARQQTTVPRTYRVEEIAEILGIGRSSAYKLVQQGQFKVVRIGSSIRISRSSFDSWLENQE